MKEIVLNNRKNGMAVLLSVLVLYILAVTGTIIGGMELGRITLTRASFRLPPRV